MDNQIVMEVVELLFIIAASIRSILRKRKNR